MDCTWEQMKSFMKKVHSEKKSLLQSFQTLCESTERNRFFLKSASFLCCFVFLIPPFGVFISFTSFATCRPSVQIFDT